MTYNHLLVRSNAAHENLANRGQYKSPIVSVELQALLRGVGELIGGSSEPMAALIQPAIDPSQPGHMSNERRVSENGRRWLVEGLPSGTGLGQVIRAAAVETPINIPLTARSQREVLDRLRMAAGFLSALPGGRFHCEWVWDGARLWLVQCDSATEAARHAPGLPQANGWLLAPAATRERSEEPAAPMVHFSRTTDDWRKLQRPKMFRRVGLPTSAIYFMPGTAWVGADDASRAHIRRELSTLCVRPVVIRCDVSTGASIDELLLPTSRASQDPDELCQFMDETSQAFLSKGVAPESWAFLPANLVDARASAMVHAHPGTQVVRVDALWGFPDGISYYPHDTYFFHVSSGRVTSRHHYKPLCIDDAWLPNRVDAPLDWFKVLSVEEVRQLAGWAITLADAERRQVQLMALARIGGARGRRACLPWHYTTFEVPTYREALSPYINLDAIPVIQNRSDLAKLREESAPGSNIPIRILPEAGLLRDDAFLVEVGSFAVDYSRPIYFEGSILGHPYYMLSRTGAAVVPLADEPRNKLVYNKLVRDLIPAVVHKAGGLARVRRVPRSAAHALLCQKLIEEAFEVRAATSGQLGEEIADVLEVVEALMLYSNLSTTEVEQIRRDKREKRGGFRDLVYLEETDVQTFRADADDALGRLPLFMDEPDTADVISMPTSSWLKREPSDTLHELARFSVSLIPPASNKVEVANLDVEAQLWPPSDSPPDSLAGHRSFVRINASYSGTRLRIRLIPTTVIEAPDQPLLPLFAAEGTEDQE